MNIEAAPRLPLILCLCIPLMAGEAPPPDANALFQHALDATDIWSQGPFHLQASVAIKMSPKNVLGEYDLYWVDKNKWRDQLILGKVQAVRIGTGHDVWSKPVDAAMSKLFLQVQNLVNLPGYLLLRSHYTVDERTSTKIGSAAAECLTFKTRAGYAPGKTCFNSESGLPLGGNTSHYDDFAGFATKKFPHSMRYETADDWAITLSVEKLNKASFPEASMFIQPEKKHLEAGCFHVLEPTPLPKHFSIDVAQAKQVLKKASTWTPIWILMTVDARGIPKDAKVIGPALFTPNWFLESTNKSRYEPATCDGVPVGGSALQLVKIGPVQ